MLNWRLSVCLHVETTKLYELRLNLVFGFTQHVHSHRLMLLFCAIFVIYLRSIIIYNIFHYVAHLIAYENNLYEVLTVIYFDFLDAETVFYN